MSRLHISHPVPTFPARLLGYKLRKVRPGLLDSHTERRQGLPPARQVWVGSGEAALAAPRAESREASGFPGLAAAAASAPCDPIPGPQGAPYRT